MAIKENSFANDLKWIDIASPTREEIEKIKQDFKFNHHLLHDCLDPDHLPKYDLIEGVHFLILRYYNHTIDKRIGTIQELSSKVAIFYTDDFIITIHRNELQFLNDIKTKIIGKHEANSTYEVIIKILRQVLETFNDPAQRLAEQVDFFETRIFLKDVEPEQLEALYFIKRKVALCLKVLTLTMEPIKAITISPEKEAEFEDVKDHHLKVSTLYSQVLDDVTNLMNIYMSFAAQKTNEVMKILTIFSVFFMPITFIVGIYGMNFEFMPELSKRWAYPAVLTLMAIVVLIIYQWFKRKKWL